MSILRAVKRECDGLGLFLFLAMWYTVPTYSAFSKKVESRMTLLSANSLTTSHVPQGRTPTELRDSPVKAL